jgi:hypothetical protein
MQGNQLIIMGISFLKKRHVALSLLLIITCVIIGNFVAWPIAAMTAVASGIESLHFTSPIEPFFFKVRMAATMALAPLLAFCLNLVFRYRRGADMRALSFLALNAGLIAAVGLSWALHSFQMKTVLSKLQYFPYITAGHADSVIPSEGIPQGVTTAVTTQNFSYATWGVVSVGVVAAIVALAITLKTPPPAQD